MIFGGLFPGSRDSCTPTKPHHNKEVDGGPVCNPDCKEEYNDVLAESK